MRYAGRVEPEAAVVTLNGQPVPRYPGGVFAGLRPLAGAAAEVLHFEAALNGTTTTVERIVRRPPRTEPAPAWPLEFYEYPVRPSGDIWLRSKDTLKVTLYASPSARAELRVGPGGEWRAMKAEPRDPDHGGVYTLTLNAPQPLATPALRQVFFRIRGAAPGGGPEVTRELASRLRLATIPDKKELWGRVTASWATFLKDGSPGKWDRFGNWIKGTPFPILDGRAGRLHTGFGKGEAGWIETGAAKVDEKFQKPSLPRLGRPRISIDQRALTLAWPSVKTPVGCVFYDESAGAGATLRVSFPGAGSLRKFNKSLGESGFISAAGEGSKENLAPTITVKLSEPLWGYAMLCDQNQGLRIVVRTRPRVGAPGRPLAGLKVMIDPGHGGPSRGAGGAAGLEEKDINQVQAAYLENFLKEMGAEVRQTRRTDIDVDLDARCEMARDWAPDLFISCHHNSMGYEGDPLSDTGPIVFYHYPHSRPLAEAIAASMNERLHPEKGKRVKSQIFRVNRNVSLCPSVLTESAYICNPYDEFKLRQAETLRESALAIAQGVGAMFK
jgi:N-acetylmuramoyl-L-alanine amidase